MDLEEEPLEGKQSGGVLNMEVMVRKLLIL
jgi:hypothetical protein